MLQPLALTCLATMLLSCLFLGFASPEGAAKEETSVDTGKDARSSSGLKKEVPLLDTSNESQHLIKGPRLFGGLVERELAVQWDDWRNRFLQFVRAGMIPNKYEELEWQHGITAQFRCVVTADKHIKSCEITESSGNVSFDNTLEMAVESLDGYKILTFPAGSRRTEVLVDHIYVTLGGLDPGHIDFGDVEYEDMPNVPTEAECQEQNTVPDKAEDANAAKN